MSCEHSQRCTGHCCRNFHLPATIEEFKADRDRALCWLFGAPSKRPRFDPVEVIRVAEMILATEDPFVFNCRHHDAATGDCRNYVNRPKLCSTYPFENTSGRCQREGCTFEEARNPPIQIRHPAHTFKAAP